MFHFIILFSFLFLERYQENLIQSCINCDNHCLDLERKKNKRVKNWKGWKFLNIFIIYYKYQASFCICDIDVTKCYWTIKINDFIYFAPIIYDQYALENWMKEDAANIYIYHCAAAVIHLWSECKWWILFTNTSLLVIILTLESDCMIYYILSTQPSPGQD